MSIKQLATQVKATASALATSSQKTRDSVLSSLATLLLEQQEYILAANLIDLIDGEANGLTATLLDRLRLTPERITGMANGVRQLIAAHDPIGGSDYATRRPNGLKVEAVRVPLGTIGIIYESRPNVTIDAAALCIKSGNAVLLRGGKEAIHSNLALTSLIRQALQSNDLPADCVALVEDTDRSSATAMLNLTGILDVLIPRGGAGLINHVVQNARVPVIETGAGVVHIFVDDTAKLMEAAEIINNAKRSRPSVCNAAETVLVHQLIAKDFLPMLAERLDDVELRGGKCCAAILGARIQEEADFNREYGELTLNLRIVENIDAAIAHITKHSTGHTECILTQNYTNANRFVNEVDAAAVIINASTRFTDGECFGLGAEIGISTQKLHARGPMGLKALTTVKYVVTGNGQIR